MEEGVHAWTSPCNPDPLKPGVKLMAGCNLGAWAYGDSMVKGGRMVDLAEILHTILFLIALPEFSPLFCPNLGGQLPPLPPASYAYGWG